MSESDDIMTADSRPGLTHLKVGSTIACGREITGNDDYILESDYWLYRLVDCPACRWEITAASGSRPEKPSDPVRHPGRIEVAEAIMDWRLDWARGKAVAYIVRAGRKDPATEIQDLQKAVATLGLLIRKLENLILPLRANREAEGTEQEASRKETA